MKAFETEAIKKTASRVPVRKLISLGCSIDLSLPFPGIGTKCQMPDSIAVSGSSHQKQIVPCVFFKQADLSSYHQLTVFSGFITTHIQVGTSCGGHLPQP